MSPRSSQRTIDNAQTIALEAWVPPIAWEYKLGNRSALEWVLDQYKEKQMPDTAEHQGD